MKYAEIGLRDTQVDNVVTVDDLGERIKILAANRADFAIASSFNGVLQLKVLGIEDIQPLSPQLNQ
ncbi:hypothetical protein [Thalassomonas actiniarum]|uniref:Solute-binding protein family 3/N-terminal domain-containing protein n=1 Tax=Thalassomonas actiniarum TaxID=485447 RepID=A0AAE9YYH4_9GAMM|nr:hypothetical protein [Thalassomonas actiniarum]WDE02694.1 hypothetical protein SG35_030300 [Thalassomonas actiniarum]